MERCVLNNVRDWLYSLTNHDQHGFVTGKSCVTNLINALDHIRSVVDKDGQFDPSILTMSNVFDRIDNGLRITKLRRLGISGLLNKLPD